MQPLDAQALSQSKVEIVESKFVLEFTKSGLRIDHHQLDARNLSKVFYKFGCRSVAVDRVVRPPSIDPGRQSPF